ncbi:signal peptidase I [bacterium]|nr:signal peptidase I [bacterium]
MKLFKTIYYIFIGVIAAIAVLLVVSAFEIPGSFKVMTVLSGSMEPAIKMGSIVVVKPVNNYKIGDIITFGPYNKRKPPTTHRIYDIEVVEGKPVYITKGDANNAPDTREVLKRDIIGKVLFDVPYLGYAVETARKPIGFVLLIIIPAVIIIYDEIRKIVEEVKKRKQES